MLLKNGKMGVIEAENSQNEVFCSILLAPFPASLMGRTVTMLGTGKTPFGAILFTVIRGTCCLKSGKMGVIEAENSQNEIFVLSY